MDFKNAIIMTDLDGTLLNDEKNISERDLESINNFCDKGGLFTIATGRGYSMAKPVAEKVGLRMPAVIFNGAAVYDFKKDEFLWQSSVTKKARGYIAKVMEAFPDIGIEVLHEQTVYVPAMNEVERYHISLENTKVVECSLSDIPEDGWLKVLFAYYPEKMAELTEFVDKHCSEETNRVLSAPIFYELLPTGVSKAYGYQKLLEVTGNEGRFTVASGDYPNDAEMVAYAKLGVAVSNAHEDVKRVADIIIGSNNEDPMTQIINYIAAL
ncbi:MAG: HAD family hydrolase [Ruminiclostridium sp.]|nr:HAD family hydrolase [Ruminiclostridium sp.]